MGLYRFLPPSLTGLKSLILTHFFIKFFDFMGFDDSFNVDSFSFLQLNSNLDIMCMFLYMILIFRQFLYSNFVTFTFKIYMLYISIVWDSDSALPFYKMRTVYHKGLSRNILIILYGRWCLPVHLAVIASMDSYSNSCGVSCTDRCFHSLGLLGWVRP